MSVFTFAPLALMVTQRLPPGRTRPVILTVSPAMACRLAWTLTPVSARPPLAVASGCSTAVSGVGIEPVAAVAILLTNDSSYWQPGWKATPVDAAFRLVKGVCHRAP